MEPRGKSTQKLLVEGSDDLHVVLALCHKHGVPVNFEIVDNRGVSNLLKSVNIWLKTSNLSSLGLILDADELIDKRWNEVKERLQKGGYDVPEHPSVGGSIIRKEGAPLVGVWLMPNNQSAGMLEDFLKFLIPQGDLLLPEAERALSRLELEQINGYKPVHRAKSLLHTWLAWQDSPGMPIGIAITHSYLDTNAHLGHDFVKWLRILFEE